MSETTTTSAVESKGAKGASKGAKGASKGAKGASKGAKGASKGAKGASKGAGARGAFGGRGARTILIENFIAGAKAPKTVREVEDACNAAHVKLTGAPIRAVRNHIVSYLYAIRNVLSRDDAGRYFVKKGAKLGAKSASK